MTLRIQKAAGEDVVVFTLSGRIEGERVAELQNLLASEPANHRIVLDLYEIDLVDRDTVRFLARCVANGIRLDHCPAYIREWIVKEDVRSRDNDADAGESKSSVTRRFRGKQP